MWYLQKAHARRYAASGGPEFEDMVKRVALAAEKAHGQEQLYVYIIRDLLRSAILT